MFSLCLVAGAMTLSACKQGNKAPSKEQAAPAQKAAAAPEKVAKAEPKKAEPKKAEAKKEEAIDNAKNCLVALSPATNFVPGTVVSLPKPEGFSRVRHFPGYQHGKGKNKPSIVISEFPMPIASAKRALSNEKIWARQEMQLVSAEDVAQKTSGESCKGTLIEVMKNGDDALHKFIWLFGNDKNSFQIMGTCPEPCAETEAKTLRQAVQAARWNPERSASRWEGLAFSIDPAPLRPMEGPMMSGYRRTFTTTGKPDKKGEQTVFQFSSSVEPAKEKTKEFAKERFEALPLESLEITKTSKAAGKSIGLRGWTIEATGSTRSGAKQWITYTMFFDQDTYWTALGMCPIAEKKTCKPMFKKIMKTASFVDQI